MHVEQIWTSYAYRNFNYLIVCEETGTALAIDPLDHERCLARARSAGWHITQVMNTHEHFDHTGGNAAVIAATGARLLVHANAKDAIPGLDREPDNARAHTLLAEVEHQDPEHPLLSTLALEKEINTFFRLHSPSVIARLREVFPDLPEVPGARIVFLKLRELRNRW